VSQLAIPEHQQIVAMLKGTIYELLSQHVEGPVPVDFRKFITIDRTKLIDYLQRHPQETRDYFASHADIGTNDTQRLFEREGKFFVAWMDHGRARSERQFPNLAEAVAEYVLIAHGLY
jgi:hypothetical protein